MPPYISLQILAIRNLINVSICHAYWSVEAGVGAVNILIGATQLRTNLID